MINAGFAKFHRGFTLMEIMVVLAIMGIVAAVAVPMYRDYMTRAEVMGAFEFAEGMRTQVMVDDSDGVLKGNGILFEAKNTNETVQLLYWTRNDPGLKGRMTVGLNLPSVSDALLPSFDLEWRENGDWHCVSSARYVKHGKPVLAEKYLPAACRAASPMAAPNPTVRSCPADQEMVTLSTGPACTPKCAAGQERDKANLSRCKPIACGPNEELIPDRGCLTIPPKPTCGAGSDAFRGYSANNDPTWSCMNACPPGQIPGKAFKCIPDPNAKPAAAAKPAAPVAPAPPAQVASIKCRSCIAGADDVCELVHEEITCTAPNNFCITFVDNQDDGTKIVKRGCGDFERVRVEWYQGTSDDDKCRERINVQQNLAFTCTFGCTTDNCNDNLRPADDSLYQPK
jgi:prepilin-type N-terminal cleavage/methylation domain-containing protein